MNKKINLGWKRKTKVMEVSYGRRGFLAVMVVLMFCLSLFCTDAGAVYQIINVGTSDVYGLDASGDYTWSGSDFGNVSQPGWVIAIASENDAYGVVTFEGSLGIDGEFSSGAAIEAYAGTSYACGLYSEGGSIDTDALNGEIRATTGQNRAVGLYSYDGSITTGDIGGTITATAGRDDAYGLDSDYGDITAGAITGTITARAEYNNAYGLFSYGSLTTGTINGKVSATAYYDDAYGLYSYGSLTTGAINGKISATATEGSYAFGLYSDSDIIIDGDIGSTAEITATAYYSYAYGLYSYGSLTTGDINGTITAEATYGSEAYGLYSSSDMIIGDIGSNAEIAATAYDGAESAASLYSDGSLNIDGINGKIVAEVTEGSNAYGLYSNWNTMVGNIGSDAEITATAGDYFARGLSSKYGTITTGDIDGTITAMAGDSDAAGLGASELTTGAINGEITVWSGVTNAIGLWGGLIVTGDISGVITAAAGGNQAVGLYGEYGSIYTGDISGAITAAAGGNQAVGLYGEDWVNIDAISGAITAEAGQDYAYGLYSDVSLTTGAISGTITATAGWYNAYGLASDYNLTTGAINGTITATATNGAGAFALFSVSEMDITGDIGSDAEITAWAETGGSYGLRNYNGSIYINGDIDGTIAAEVNGASASGLRSDNGSIYTGAINGMISATATNGFYAIGLESLGSINTGAINGNIIAWAKTGNAIGLAGGSIYIDGDIDGTIAADVNNGSNAYGLAANGSITTGAINGTITAMATNGSDAYGLYADSDLTVGDIGSDAHITATAGTDRAVGLFSGATVDSLITGAISGTVHAQAYDYAYGILSYGPMDVLIDGGEVNAIADSGTHVAAIQSGRIGEDGLETQNANDMVEIAAGSTIVGNIDLAETTDDDMLTLSGNDSESTTLADDILNVEDINITGGQWFINGTVSSNAYGIVVSGGILSGTGWLEDVYIAGGTLNPGNSIGTINIDGDLNFSPDGVFEVEFNNSEEADLAVVAGTAALEGGTIRVKALEGIDHSFSATVINANSLSGEFSTIEGGTAFLISVDYEDNNVILNIEPNLFVSIKCDFDSNGVVNFEDMVRFVDQWLWVGQAGGITEDIVQDGTVNFLDYCVCAENWLKEYPVRFYSNHLDSDPKWTTEGEWAYGQPMGGGGAMYGNPDPTSGCTGLNVYGVNLNGDYNLTVTGEAYYLTAGPFNCTQYSNVRLVFARWLNTDYPPYISNTIEVSNNGNDWQMVWQYPGTEPLEDSAWQRVEYDISQIADGSSAVYVRWGYEITHDRAYPYSGWNIDDISLWGNPAVE